ncbi:hypothetical protein [Candidatus Mycoplasma haematominutum]|uniref:Uncharacterized protein n=1 Tax=Candidatus Mycoplasma haematominutum 'Birmingham 1' TaxID=1116213 RepID=G8C2P3_9MOLU|nr:hypothetical protein [Candidatus Mycoplasma haematominutum]CCE66591.1 hypothetical protein MHM_00730 [Candidatus Mycoplasma haematominutum 'Birmingham 1']
MAVHPISLKLIFSVIPLSLEDEGPDVQYCGVWKLTGSQAFNTMNLRLWKSITALSNVCLVL